MQTPPVPASDEECSTTKSDICRILVLNQNRSELQDVCTALRSQLQEAWITPVAEIGEYSRVIKSEEFDLVIMDYGFGDGSGQRLIQELRFRENEPAVLVVSGAVDPRIMAEISNLRCHRYIQKDDKSAWCNEIGSEARRAMRLKKLEDENKDLLIKLTEANAMLADRNKKLDEFSVVVAHDIRGVLSGISMRLECLIDLVAEMDERSSKMLQGAFNATRHAIDMVQEAYNFARLGSQASKMQSLNLKLLVEEIVQDLCIEEKADLCLSIGELPKVWGNEALLRRVFINLITNAYKYNDKNRKEIGISVKSYIKSGVAEFVIIAIQDNGRGILDEDLAELFRMFKRGKNTPSDSDGTGIGLAVVRKILELHNGEIDVESTHGVGTTFLVKLPLRKVEVMERGL